MTDGWPKPIGERVAAVEEWIHCHEDRHGRDHAELILAKQNEVTLSAASSHPVDAVLKWVAGLIALVLVAVLGWVLKK